jgi:hypothetical protein
MDVVREVFGIVLRDNVVILKLTRNTGTVTFLRNYRVDFLEESYKISFNMGA